jgi:hypothetical protein
MKELFAKLNISNHETLLEFLVTYSRFEYALKRAGYTKNENGDAEANIEKFISDKKMNFSKKNNESLESAVNYLLSYPAEKQTIKDGKLGFGKHVGTTQGPDICRLYHCIRITRNNLFHGGKYPHKPITDPSRNMELIENSIIVLNEFIKLDDNVKEHFFGSLE